VTHDVDEAIALVLARIPMKREACMVLRPSHQVTRRHQ
jgi:hypothetical protein